MKQKKTILILWFQNKDENMYPHTYDFVNELEKHFDEVIYKNIRMTFFDFYEFDKELNTKIMMKNDISTDIRWLFKQRKKFKMVCNELKKMKFQNHDFLIIAIDYLAFFIAQTIFKRNVCFYLYHIMDNSNPLLECNGVNKFLYDYTVKNIKKCNGVIIQDYNRAKEFEKNLKVKIDNFVYLPISLNDNEYCYKAYKKIIKKNLDNKIIKLTQIGDVKEGRHYEELIKSFQQLPKKYELVISGRIVSKVVDKLITQSKRKIFIRTKILKSDDIAQKISDCDIGFVGYGNNDVNLKFVEMSSSQLVEFLRIGMPIIAMGSQSFIDYVNNNKIGIGLKDIDGIYNALEIICNNYKQMSYNSRKKFEKKYCLENNFNDYFINNFIELFNNKCKKNRLPQICLIIKNIFKPQYVALNPLISGVFIKIIYIYYEILRIVLTMKTRKYINKSKKVAIFGTGDLANIYLKKLEAKDIEIIYFIDNSQEKWNLIFNGKPVKNINYLLLDGYNKIDAIVLASNERKIQMWSQLRKNGFKKYIIFDL